MEGELRISAGAIVAKEGKILLVRSKYSNGIFLVGPGGGVLNNERIKDAVVREVREETGLEVRPHRILFVEDLFTPRRRTVKIWFLCELTGGQLSRTEGAIEEGIIEARWYRKDQLKNEAVYPAVLLTHDWDAFFKDNWETKYLETKGVDF